MARAKAHGVEIEYETFGDAGAAETVVLINGLGSQMTRWPAELCERLAAHGLGVVRFDNRDVGKSTWLPEGSTYTVFDMAADTIAVMDAVGVSKAHIVGMSMGGMIGQMVAAEYPQRTLSLTSIMSNTGNPDLPPPDVAFLRQVPPDPAKDRGAYLDHAEKSALHISSPGYPWPAGVLRARAEAELERAFHPAGTARQMAGIGASGDRRAKVRTITAPTVVLHGQDDPLVPVEGGKDTAACIAGAELRVIPGMGHDMPPALYDTFEAAILRAVERSHAPGFGRRELTERDTDMAEAPPEFITKLDPEDEFCHAPDDATNYNESMYFNVFDHKRKAGGWFRIGNRPNEGYAEMSVCLYLPDGRIGFMFGRPKIDGNKELNAGGLKIEVVEPFKRLRVTYSGKVCLMENPHDMADPSKAFRENPNLPCAVELDYVGVSPMMGGETVRADGKPIVRDASKSFAKAHYEQHVNAVGFFQIGDERFEIDGYGLRDKSWGPRFWSAINWYRWCPLNFGPDFGMMLSVVCGDSTPREGGMVFRDGIYDYISECKMETDWDENGYQTALRAKVKTRGGKSYDVSGKVLSLIPLRNRRKTPDGAEVQTRITEGMTEYRCGDLVGYGLSEYLDQIVDGQPTGKVFEDAAASAAG